MRKAFTLIEVLVSVSIISIVVLGLLSSSATNGKLSKRLSDKYKQKDEFSIVLLNANKNFHNSQKSLYDFLGKKYKIKNDELKTWLKNKKFEYTDKEFSTMKLLDLDIEELTNGEYDKSMLPDFAFNIQKVKSLTPKGSTIGYTFNLQ